MTDTAVDARPWSRRQRGDFARLRKWLARPFHEYHRRNPELAKARAFVQQYVAVARDLLDLDDGQAPLRTSEVRQRALQDLSRDVSRLSIDSAWDLANGLKRQLLVLGDVPYVWAQLEYEAERDKKPNKWHPWSEHYSAKKLRALIAARDHGSVDRTVHLDAVRSLQKLYELRAEEGLDRRARAAQKCRYLTALVPFLLIALVTLSASIHEVGREGVWKIALAASAGALGAILSGVFRVRDRLVELDDLRSFGHAMRVQPIIGATAGLVTLLVLETGAVELGSQASSSSSSWAGLALFTFVAGFSEAFFLGLVERVAVIPDKHAPQER